MKESKSILARYTLLGIFFQIAIVAAIALPPVAPYRALVAERLSIPETALWIPLLVILVIGNVLIASRLNALIVDPLHYLVNQTKLGGNTFAFKTKSRNAEEDTLKHFIESQALKRAEMEQEVTRMEEVVRRTEEAARMTPWQIDEIEGKLREAESKAEASLQQVAALGKSKSELERRVDELKRDLKTRIREIETLREEARERSDEDAANLTSILAERLRNPLSLISNLSWRLSRSWAETPPAQVRDGLEEISRHAEEQLNLLKKYQSSKADEAGRDAV